MISSIFAFLGLVFQAIGQALVLDPGVTETVRASGAPNLLLLCIALLCGASLLLGQSVILFLNRVPPARFALSLVLSGFIFAAGLAVWALVTWVVGSLISDTEPRLITMVQVALVSSAPFIFGVFMLIPYAGVFIGRLLAVWSLLIAFVAIEQLFALGFLSTLLVVALGWLLQQLLGATVGKPLLWLRAWLWRTFVGNPRYRQASDLLELFTGDESLPEIRKRL